MRPRRIEILSDPGITAVSIQAGHLAEVTQDSVAHVPAAEEPADLARDAQAASAEDEDRLSKNR